MGPERLDGYSSQQIASALVACDRPGQVLPSHLRRLVGAGRFAGIAKTISYRVRDQPLTAHDTPAAARGALSAILAREAMISRGDVVVIGGNTSPPPACGLMGSLFATLYANLGAVGVITDGYVRDVADLRESGLQVIAAGTCPTNALGRITTSMAEPVSIGTAVIAPGDWVIADDEGVVCVPAAVLPAVCERLVALR